MVSVTGLALFSAVVGVLAVQEREAVSPAISQVLTMLRNIESMIGTESTTDETEHQEFLKWSAAEATQTEAHIGEIQTEIQTTTAALADLRAQKSELETTLARVTAELTSETSQLNAATERRNEENSAYVTEQQNFENAINACTQAVKILAAHYGNGEAHEATRPQFMSLLNKYMKTLHDTAKKSKGAHTMALMQGARAPNFETYTESSGDAGNIVDQIHELSETFSEDKQSAIEAEQGLQRAYDTLRAQKQELINTLTSEKDTQTSQLNTVNQNIAESAGSLQQAQQLLVDRQSYATNLVGQRNAATVAFNNRKADREAELEAVGQAVGVLEQVSLVQKGASLQRARAGAGAVDAGAAAKQGSFGAGTPWMARILARASASAHRAAKATRLLQVAGPKCSNCPKALALLKQRASSLHSQRLMSAVAATMGNEQLRDVTRRLQELVANLDAEQQTEREHKAWCETEQQRTSSRRDGHTYAVGEITQTINGLTELISMKQTQIQIIEGDITAENANMAEQTQIRNTDQHEYEEDLQDTMDAIAALNEAIKILADFYASRNNQALVQTHAHGKAGAHTDPNSGSQVVNMISETRQQFERAEADLKSTEASAVQSFGEVRTEHRGLESDLNHNEDVVTVEEQTAQQALESNRDDLTNNQSEIAAANAYLQRLGQSCDPLIQNFDQRSALRAEEKAAIQDAIRILADVH